MEPDKDYPKWWWVLVYIFFFIALGNLIGIVVWWATR